MPLTLYKLFMPNNFILQLAMVKKNVLFPAGFLNYIRHGLEWHILNTFLSLKITLNLWGLNGVTDIKHWMVVTENL